MRTEFYVTTDQGVPRGRGTLIDNEFNRSARDRARDFFLNQLIHRACPHRNCDVFRHFTSQAASDGRHRRPGLRVADQTFIFEGHLRHRMVDVANHEGV